MFLQNTPTGPDAAKAALSKGYRSLNVPENLGGDITRRLEIETPIMVLLTMLCAGAHIITLNGKSRLFLKFTNFPGSIEVRFWIDGAGYVGYCMIDKDDVAFSDLM